MKIAIFGAGRVGASTAFALQMRGIGREIVLVDVREEVAKGEALDLLQGSPEAYPQAFKWGEEEAEGADVFIVTAGVRREPNESRLSLIQRNLGIFRDILLKIGRLKKEGSLLIVVSNPVDVLTYFAHLEGNFPSGKVIGLGTLLDTLRLRAYLASWLNVDPRDVNAIVLGEHGDSMVFPFSLASIGGVPLLSFPGVSEEGLKEIREKVRGAGAEMIRLKGGAGTAVGMAVAKLLEAIERDSRSMMPVSTYLEGAMTFRDVCLSLPCMVGGEGILQVIEPPLREDEMLALRNSYDALRGVLESLR